MGVPRLWPWILRFFPKAVKHFTVGGFKSPVDYLYLDANGLLHGAAQQVYWYGPNKPVVNRYAHLSEKQKLEAVFNIFFEGIRQVTQIITPKKVLYIAIDGPAPLGKQAQQRQRRFIAAKERANAPFDSNSISPGTMFMHELTKYMNYAIRREMNSYYEWRDLKVYFSGPRVAGEGEHKIMNFLRSLADIERMKSTHCLFGPDGDLIMLTLAAHIPRMYLFREDQFNTGYYHYVDMGMVRELLPENMFLRKGRLEGTRDVETIVDDFILIGFFVGNDFLPKIRMFLMLEDGLEQMIYAYSETSKNGTLKDAVLTKNGKIQLSGFTKFISRVQKEEVRYIQDQSKVEMPDSKFVNHTLLKHMKNGKLNFDSYRLDYYKKADAGDEKSVHKMCEDYVKSIIWVFRYYLHGVPSWRWYYGWHYAPLMSDLLKFLQGITEDQFDGMQSSEESKGGFQLASPALPFVQLLSILPPTSRNLLPGPLWYLFTWEKSPLVKAGYFEDFKIDYEGVWKEHMGVVKLSFVDYDVVRKGYDAASKNLKLEHKRNDPDTPYVFSHDATKDMKYISDYGTIQKLTIVKESTVL